MKNTNNFDQELKNAHVKDDFGIVRFNPRLLSKEASKYFFIKTVTEYRERTIKQYGEITGDKYFVPDDLEQFANELLSIDNVYIALTPNIHYFNKFGEYVEDINVSVRRGSANFDYKKEILDVIKTHYLDHGAVVYFYVYYGLLSGICDGWGENMKIIKDVNTYWWRMTYKQDNK